MINVGFADTGSLPEALTQVEARAAVESEPQNSVQLEGKKAEQCLKLLEALQDHDDVQNVYANLEVDDSALQSGVA